MKKSNCFFFYLALRWRCLKRGRRGMFCMRRSNHAWWLPHILFQYRQPTGRFRMVSFVPVKPIRGKLLPIRFEGRVQWGDPIFKPDLEGADHDHDDADAEILALAVPVAPVETGDCVA